MPARHWLLMLLVAACAFVIGLYIGGPDLAQDRDSSETTSRGAEANAAGSAIVAARNPTEDTPPFTREVLFERLRALGAGGSQRWRRDQLQNLADQVPISEIPNFVNHLDFQFLPEGTELLKLLFARWAQEDPQKATEYALSPPGASTNWQALNAALSEWIAKDPQTVLNWAKALRPGTARDQVLAILAPELARSDPAAAFRLLGEFESVSAREYRYAEVLTRWADADPTAAATAVESLPESRIRNTAISNLARSWARSDPHAAFAWTLQLGQGESRQYALQEAARIWARKDVDAALKEARALEDPKDREMALGGIAATAASSDPEKAWSLIGELTNPQTRNIAMSSLVYSMAEIDLDRAAQLAENLAPSHRDSPLKHVIERIQSTDPERALALSTKMGSDGEQGTVIAGVFNLWLKNSPDRALDWLGKNSLPRSSSWKVQDSFSQWAGQNQDAAIALVREPNAAKQMYPAITGALKGIANRDPELAAELATGAAANLVDPMTFGSIAASWVKKDPAAATRWLPSLPPGFGRRNAAGSIARTWATVDPVATASWIERLQPGDLRDSATAGFAYHSSATDPESALTWAGTIQEKESRDSTIAELLKTWVTRDPNSAKRWAQTQSDLPQEARNHLPRD